MSLKRTGTVHSKETRKKLSERTKKNWQNPIYREKQLGVMFKGLELKPNKPEILLNCILQQLFPNQYKYVGDGQVIIAGKCPDFISIKGKKIIELFGDYWHSKKITGRTKLKEEWQRIKHFTKYGHQILIVWESELKDIDKLIDKLRNFSYV